MDDSRKELVLVTPVWNDASRLARFGPELAAALAQWEKPVRWIVADDGSSPDEVERLNELVESLWPVYPAIGMLRSAVRNRKGGTIRLAWDASPDAEWLAFIDADGAISTGDLARLLERAMEDGATRAVVAIREDSPENPVERPFTRNLAFRIFSSITRWLLAVPFRDTQCGAKIIPGAAYHSLRPRLRETGFAFDAELLLALRESGCPIEEVAVAWSEQDGGKVHPLRDGWGMLAALWRIRGRARAGHYRA